MLLGVGAGAWAPVGLPHRVVLEEGVVGVGGNEGAEK